MTVKTFSDQENQETFSLPDRLEMLNKVLKKLCKREIAPSVINIDHWEYLLLIK